MKKRICSLLLIFSLLLSLFTTYGFAADTVTADESNMVNPYIHYRNSYGDANDDFGGSLSLANAKNSYMETRAESNGNKYGYFCFNDRSGVDGSNGNVYFQLNPSKGYTVGAEANGYLILDMDFNDFGAAVTTKQFLEIHSGEGSLAADQRVAASNIINVSNDSKGNYFHKGSSANILSQKIYIPSNEWVHLRFEFSVLDASAAKYHLKCYVGEEYFEFDYQLGTPKTINQIRIGSSQSTNVCFGLDNITLYSAPTNLPSYDSIGTVAGALAMKIGAENAKADGAQIELANPPILSGDDIYCPVSAINDFSGKSCPAQYVVSLEGADYIHIENIEEAYGLIAKSYAMGLILVGSPDDVNAFDGSQTAILELMKTFVFNLPSASTLKEDVKSYTNNFDHPYLIADADKFAELKAIYEKGNNKQLTDPEELLLYSYISKYVSSAESKLSSITGATPTGTYSGIKSSQIPKNSNYDKYNNNGYDNGGRVNSIPSTNLYYFAFAYQMTGHLNYARAAYDYSLALGEWNHWGPSHFLNCADAAAPFSIAYDWLYDAYKVLETSGELSKFDSEKYSTKKIANIILTHAIVPGYIQSNALNCPWPGSVESRYATTTNNWNAVCTSGMMASALAIIGEEISVDGITFTTQTKSNGSFTNNTGVKISEIGNTAIHVGLSTYADYAAKLATMNMSTLMRYGLGEYAPDGSYVESPGYWTYGTNTFFRMIATLITATGDDYGFMDCWGMDTTSYFAIHSESSDYKTWSYNDGSVGTQNSEFFMFVGDFYGDDNLVRVRKKQLSEGKGYSLFDILFYNTDITGEPTLATEYYMQGIDGYAVRSSWDKGAIYAGIMGGPNTVSHGHMDAGVFTYHNKGKIWFHDLGADQYNITYTNEKGQKKGYFSNYELYRIGAEGHNIIAITSEQDTLPYGQATNANPGIVDYYSSVEGGYAIIDLSKSYGEHVTSAKRGMLFTDSRSTVVIQDEIVFNGPKTAYWFGHYNIGSGYVDSVKLSADGKTAFMISGGDMIRVSIVSDNSDLKFEIMDAYTYLFDITHRVDREDMDQPNTEYNRDNIRKLAIKCENVETLNLAVVIEEVSNYNVGTSYSWTEMAEWNVDGVKTPETETKFKADYSDAGMHVGSVSDNLPDQFVLHRVDYDDASYIQISSNANSATDAGSLDFNIAGNNSLLIKRYRYLVADLDIYTEGQFIDGASLGFNTSNGYTPVVTFTGNSIKIGTYTRYSNDWLKITLVYDVENDVLYAYVNNTKAVNITSLFGDTPKSLVSLSLSISENASTDMMESISLDNIYLRTVGTMYDDTSFKSLLSSGTPISEWEHNISRDPQRAPLAECNGEFIYTAFELSDALESSSSISILRDSYYAVLITVPVTVDTNAYVFNFRSNSFILNIDDEVYSFVSGSITVTWHIGNETFTEAYSSASTASFKKSHGSIGKITEVRTDYADGGVGYSYYTTGWSNVNGGMYLTPNEMVVSSENCEFWLVNNVPIVCDFVVVSSDGTVTKKNGESNLRTELSTNNSNQRVVLCSDMEILNTSPLPLATRGKNLYLNGHTLKHAQADVHTFIYNNASADFNIYGPGSIVSEGSRTMFTSAAISSTNKYGIKASDVDFHTNMQLGDLRMGQHTFTNCTFTHNPTTAKTFLTVWDRNGLSKVTGALNGTSSNSGPLEGGTTNLITVKFIGCDIQAGNRGSTPLVSYTSGTYSEVYFIDSTVITSGVLVEANYSGTYNPDIKMSISGNSAVIASGIAVNADNVYNDVKFGDGVVTSLMLADTYLTSGAKLTNNYNDVLRYKVAKNYALVSWLRLDGTTIKNEYVAVGTTPKLIDNDVIEYLRSINTGSVVYRYSTTAVASNEAVNLTPVALDSSTILYSMNLATDFAIEIYISKAQFENGVIDSVAVNNVLLATSAFEEIEMNGTEYYRYRITRISPANACKVQNIVVSYSNSTSKVIDTSAVSYLENLLRESVKDTEKILAVKILKYIKSAYLYAGNDNITDLMLIDSIIDAFAEYDVLYSPIESSVSSTNAVRDGIASAKLFLSASARFRFKLNPKYTGEISITYLDVIKKYDVTNGLCNGYDYIELELNAAYLDSDLLIVTDGGSTNYNLKSYYTNLNTADKLLDDMLLALNEYSAAAKEFLKK